MKNIVAIVALACFVALVGFAQESATMKQEVKKSEKAEVAKSAGKWHGYVVDAMCAKGIMKKDNRMEKAAKHTKECALDEACAASGFGLFYDNKYYKFDEAGDMMAKSAIEHSAKDKELMYDVTGTLDGDKIMVASLDEMKVSPKEPIKKADDMKKMEKKPAHKN